MYYFKAVLFYLTAVFCTQTLTAGSNEPSLETELALAQQAAIEAGEVILKYWRDPSTDVQLKPGEDGRSQTEVTQADYASNELICRKLVEHFPTFGLLTEEKIDSPAVQQAIAQWRTAEWTWMVDPLDGTSSFSSGKAEFGIHIGLCHHGKPVLGVNHYPALNETYYAVKGHGAYKVCRDGTVEKISVVKEREPLVLVSSGSTIGFATDVLESLGLEFSNLNTRSAGLRICVIAEGKGDLYMNSGDSGSLWDYCSAHAILEEAGGSISTLSGAEIDYRGEYNVTGGCICASSSDLELRLVQGL